MHVRIPLVLLVAAIGMVHIAAQEVRYRPTDQGPWRPWGFTAIASARQSRGATAAEVQAWQVKLQQLGAIVKRSSAVATPIGFAAELYGNLDGYGPPAPGEPAGKSLPLAGNLTFAAFPLIEFTRNGRLMNEDMKGGETETLAFRINHIDRTVFSQTMPGEWSGEDPIGFTEPKTLPSVAGLTRIDDVLVVRNNTKPLWVPLSLAEAMAPVLKQRRDIFEGRRDNYAKQVAEFAQWQTPGARAARRADWQTAAASMGTQGAAFLANMEKSEEEIEKAKRQQLAPRGPEERGVTESEQDLQEAEAVLTGASPEERSGPSCYALNARTIAQKFRPLTPGASPGCQPLVKTNWNYFDPKLARTAPQIIMITSYERCLTPESMKSEVRGGCTVNRQLIETMDWTAVRALLDK